MKSQLFQHQKSTAKISRNTVKKLFSSTERQPTENNWNIWIKMVLFSKCLRGLNHTDLKFLNIKAWTLAIILFIGRHSRSRWKQCRTSVLPAFFVQRSCVKAVLYCKNINFTLSGKTLQEGQEKLHQNTLEKQLITGFILTINPPWKFYLKQFQGLDLEVGGDIEVLSFLSWQIWWEHFGFFAES